MINQYREIEEFIVLKPKTYSLVTHGQSAFDNGTVKEKGIKREKNGKHEGCYNAIMDNKERNVEYKMTGIRSQPLKLIKEV